MTTPSEKDEDVWEECECEYPHGHDFDPYNFERCTCKEGCWHIRPYLDCGGGLDDDS